MFKMDSYSGRELLKLAALQKIRFDGGILLGQLHVSSLVKQNSMCKYMVCYNLC